MESGGEKGASSNGRKKTNNKRLGKDRKETGYKGRIPRTKGEKWKRGAGPDKYQNFGGVPRWPLGNVKKKFEKKTI